MIKKTEMKKSLYALCAAAGFLSALLAPCYSADAEADRIFSAAELVQNGETAERNRMEEVSAAKFLDVDVNGWYYPYVDALVKNGIINGTSDTTYSPGGTFTAAEASAVITRYLGLSDHAKKRQYEIVAAGAGGANEWYIGYIQTMYDIGVMRDGEFGISLNDGYVSVSDVSACTRPLERYEFAILVTRSFDIDTSVVRASVPYAEICDNGNILITGGRYDETVAMYDSQITDIATIPAGCLDEVRKAYYNGIFNGDEFGNFNPYAQLSRAEMSKVVAVITDPSLRTRTEYRTMHDIMNIPEESYVIDGMNEKTIDRHYSKKILETVAKGFSAMPTDGGIVLEYTPINVTAGYFLEVRLYDKKGDLYTETALVDMSSSEKTAVTAGKEGARAMFVLRRASDAKVEGAYRADVSSDGSVTYDDLFKPVI